MTDLIFKSGDGKTIETPYLINSVGEEYFIIKKEASKTKIKEAITAGKDVQGARLIENRNLQIK